MQLMMNKCTRPNPPQSSPALRNIVTLYWVMVSFLFTLTQSPANHKDDLKLSGKYFCVYSTTPLFYLFSVKALFFPEISPVSNPFDSGKWKVTWNMWGSLRVGCRLRVSYPSAIDGGNDGFPWSQDNTLKTSQFTPKGRDLIHGPGVELELSQEH